MIAAVPQFLTTCSTRFLLAVVLLGDIAAIASFVPLERFSLAVAADKSSNPWLLLALLLANMFLLLLIFFLMAASATLAARYLARRRVRVITGTVHSHPEVSKDPELVEGCSTLLKLL